MTFTKACFIRKDTPELREKLKSLGYLFLDGDKRDGLIADRSGFVYSIYEKNVLNSTYNCGTNEKLFLAIAAIRNDTDVNQWFVSPEGIFVFNKKYEYISEVSLKWRKATVEELIEYFKED